MKGKKAGSEAGEGEGVRDGGEMCQGIDKRSVLLVKREREKSREGVGVGKGKQCANEKYIRFG